MESSSSSDADSPLRIPNLDTSFYSTPKKYKKRASRQKRRPTRPAPPAEEEDGGRWSKWRNGSGGGGGGVMLEGYVEAAAEGVGEVGSEDGGEGMAGRTKSLTDEDLEELKGCLDLGFGFSYEEIPELCGTLPALELCYSMSQKFLDEQQQSRSPEGSGEVGEVCHNVPSVPIANWKISSPGDHPEDVKARLKYWAQAVACTVRLCS